MSNYYDSLGQDLAPMMGMPPLDQTPPYGPERPPPMPPPAALPPGSLQGQTGPNMPPPMSGQLPPYADDPFNKAVGQAAKVEQVFAPSAQMGPPTGARPQPPAPPVPGVGANASVPGGGGAPMPPPMPGTTSGAGGSAVPFGPSMDWASATGLAPSGQDRMTSMMGGIGKGLSAAAGNSNKAGAVFSRGAGGAITGEINEAQEQQKLKLGQRNAYFNQTSTAFKDAMTQKSTDAKDLYWQARAQQYQALAKAGVKAPWNADALALARADDEARKNYASDRADLTAIKGQLPPDEFTKRMDALQQGKGKYQADAYKKFGVDPNKAEQIRTQGMRVEKPFNQIKAGDWYIDPTGKAVKKTANDASYGPADTVKAINPFDTTKMDLTGFHQSVPNGAYYTTAAGLHQRTVPPPGAPDQQQLQQSIQNAEQEENYTGGPQ